MSGHGRHNPGAPRFEQLEPRVLLSGDLFITEFMAVNDTALADEDGDYPDWVEIHNASASEVNLDGWYLTDSAGNLDKWRFPAVTIPAGGYMVVFASRKDRTDPARPLHTDFKLAGGGEYLALVRPDGQSVEHEYAPQFPPQVPDVSYGLVTPEVDYTLVGPGAAVKALVPADGSLALDWTGAGFDDAGWLAGTTGVGYERQTGYEALIGTDVESAMYGTNSSVYIRVPFEVADPTAFDSLTLRVKYDDGFVAYLNGREVASRNAPSAPVPPEVRAWNAQATAEHPDAQAVVFENIDISTHLDALAVGTNVLAIQGLNISAGDGDLLVVPELLAAGPGQPDPSLAGYFTVPTPGEPNDQGAAELGPLISQVQHSPQMPADDTDLVVTARVAESFRPVDSVALHYRVMFGQEVSVAMFDDGAHGDGQAADGVYGASIPASAAGPGQMVRYYVTAADDEGNVSRCPVFLDPAESPEYFGTVVADQSLVTNLPVLHWFVQDPSAANTGTGTRASVFYDGEFYDNVFVRIRGGTARGYYKKCYKFDFNRGHWFRYDPNRPRVREININSTWPDKAYVRQTLSFETFRDAGAYTCESFMVRLQQNGDFFSVAIFVEQVDEEYLQRQGLDPNGALYKFQQKSGDLSRDVEKKTRRDEDWSDLYALMDGLRGSGTTRERFLFDNLNIPSVINYWAVNVLLMDGDLVWKNFYYYRDTEGSGEWTVLPWDKDLTFGRHWSGSGGVLNDDIAYAAAPLDGWIANDYLAEPIFNTPSTREMYLRRARTLIDELLQPPGTPYEQRHFETRIDELVAQMADDVALDAARWRPYDYGTDMDINQAVSILKNDYLERRRQYLFSHSQLPASQPANPSIRLGGVDAFPVSGDQDQEYIELVNPNSYAVDISGWQLTGAVEFTFAPGTVIPAGRSLYVSPDVAKFRSRPVGPSGGQCLFVVGNYDGHLAREGELLRLLDADGNEVFARFTRSVEISEVLNHPSSSAGGWIELHNPTELEMDISGWGLSDEPAQPMKYTLPAGTVLEPGQYLLLSQQDDFGSAFALSPLGGSVCLTSSETAGALAGYQDAVSFAAAPEGLSFGQYFTPANETEFVLLSTPTPGAANATARFGPVVINEIMYHPAAGCEEFIELSNPTTSPVKLYDPDHPAHTWELDGAVSYVFPQGLEVPAGGYLLVTLADVTDPATEAAFRAEYNVPADVPVLGPYSGKLTNAGGSVGLYAPGEPEVGGQFGRIPIDHVSYDNGGLWPVAADGEGPSLERIDPLAYGNDPANWEACPDEMGSPGRENLYLRVYVTAAPLSGMVPLTVDFTGRATCGAPCCGYDYRWDFGDGGSSPEQSPAYVYEDFGVYTAVLTVRDGLGNEASADACIVVGAVRGDANGDGRVGIADLSALADNYLEGHKTWVDGDFNGDGFVTIADLGALADNYGYDARGGSGAPAGGQAASRQSGAVGLAVVAEAASGETGSEEFRAGGSGGTGQLVGAGVLEVPSSAGGGPPATVTMPVEVAFCSSSAWVESRRRLGAESGSELEVPDLRVLTVPLEG